MSLHHVANGRDHAAVCPRETERTQARIILVSFLLPFFRVLFSTSPVLVLFFPFFFFAVSFISPFFQGIIPRVMTWQSLSPFVIPFLSLFFLQGLMPLVIT